MLNGKRVAVILPAYNAARTLEATYAEIPRDLVDNVILVDDFSSDRTAAVSRALGIETVVHPVNRGYGGNQKTCYRLALERGADIVVMLHPDYQYTPKLIRAMVSRRTSMWCSPRASWVSAPWPEECRATSTWRTAF